MDDMIHLCVGGALADSDGVCTEHGETACVIGLPAIVRTEHERLEPAGADRSDRRPLAVSVSGTSGS